MGRIQAGRSPKRPMSVQMAEEEYAPTKVMTIVGYTHEHLDIFSAFLQMWK